MDNFSSEANFASVSSSRKIRAKYQYSPCTLHGHLRFVFHICIGSSCLLAIWLLVKPIFSTSSSPWRTSSFLMFSEIML